jgi:DNA-binding transcriptional ArsR family regulator
MTELEKSGIKAKLFRGLADSTRLTILECLKEKERSVTEIMTATGQRQSNVSNHLKCLLECGLVKNQRRGKNVFYTLGSKDVATLLEDSDRILHDIYQNIYYCVRYQE